VPVVQIRRAVHAPRKKGLSREEERKKSEQQTGPPWHRGNESVDDEESQRHGPRVGQPERDDFDSQIRRFPEKILGECPRLWVWNWVLENYPVREMVGDTLVALPGVRP
jgi:hypothetical protein